MGLFDKIKEPVLLKTDSTAQKQLEQLTALLENTTDPTIRKKMELDQSMLKAGIQGEDQILFELKNSHLPIVVLHDLYYEFNDLSTQIDFLVVTHNAVIVLECKNLYGDIRINPDGSFIRNIHGHKSGIYSPITQNERHLLLLKELLRETRTNVILKATYDRYFESHFQSIVVLANNQTILNATHVKKELRKSILRADQLNAYIKEQIQRTDLDDWGQSYMQDMGNWLLSHSTTNPTDYLKNYETSQIKKTEEILCPKCGSRMIKRVSTKGSNVGKEFYGCSNFPKCRGIVNIDSSSNH